MLTLGFALKFICNLVHGMVKSKPLMPILFGKESSESVIRRKRWAKAGWFVNAKISLSMDLYTVGVVLLHTSLDYKQRKHLKSNLLTIKLFSFK